MYRRHSQGLEQAGRRLFGFSILYLFVLFAMLLVDWSFGQPGVGALVRWGGA